MYQIGVRGRGAIHRPFLLPLLPVGFLLLLAAEALASSHAAFPFFPLLFVALLLALRLPRRVGARRRSAAATTAVRRTLPAGEVDQEKELLGAMERRGEITATRAALETSLSVAAAEEILSALAGAGHLRVGVQEGSLVYSLWD